MSNKQILISSSKGQINNVKYADVKQTLLNNTVWYTEYQINVLNKHPQISCKTKTIGQQELSNKQMSSKHCPVNKRQKSSVK